jgi:hypothetical protein
MFILIDREGNPISTDFIKKFSKLTKSNSFDLKEKATSIEPPFGIVP